MEESNNTARNVAQAIVAVLEWNCPPDTRKAAVSYLESVSFFAFFSVKCFFFLFVVVVAVYVEFVCVIWLIVMK